MQNSAKLAKQILAFSNTHTGDIEGAVTTMIENFRLKEINTFINNKNLENYNSMNTKEIFPKKDIEGITKVQVWPRGK